MTKPFNSYHIHLLLALQFKKEPKLNARKNQIIL